MAENIEVTPALVEFWEAVLSDAEFTYEDIKERGGPSQPTLTKLTRVGESISAASARTLEDAIGLERGSLRSVAAGGPTRWRPDFVPPGEPEYELGFQDQGRHRGAPDVVDGYSMAGAWAHVCWRVGADRQLYYDFIDASVALYKSALEAREAGRPRDTEPRPIPEPEPSRTLAVAAREVDDASKGSAVRRAMSTSGEESQA